MIASPYARKLARQGKVDVSQAQGSGPGGRIVAADVQKLIESGGGTDRQQASKASAAADAGAGAGAASDGVSPS